MSNRAFHYFDKLRSDFTIRDFQWREPLNITARLCDVSFTSQIVKSDTVITMHCNLIYFIHLINALKGLSFGTSLRSHHQSWNVANHQETFEKSHLVTLLCLSFNDAFVKLPWLMPSPKMTEKLSDLVTCHKRLLMVIQSRVSKFQSPESLHVTSFRHFLVRSQCNDHVELHGGLQVTVTRE